MMGRWVVGVILLFVILLMTLPDTDEKSLSRIGSASMLACTKDIRAQIGEQLLHNETVATEHKITCPDLITSLKVDERGRMVITGNKYKVTMQLSPVIESGKLRWSCTGEPADSVTNLCKP